MHRIIEKAARSNVTRPRPWYHTLNHHIQDFQPFGSIVEAEGEMPSPRIRVGGRRWDFVQETEVTEVGICFVCRIKQ